MAAPTTQELLDAARLAYRRILTSGQSVTLGDTTFNRANLTELRQEIDRAIDEMKRAEP